MTAKLEARLRRLENATVDDKPQDFILTFVSTDGAPNRVCRLIDGELVDAESDYDDNRD